MEIKSLKLYGGPVNPVEFDIETQRMIDELEYDARSFPPAWNGTLIPIRFTEREDIGGSLLQYVSLLKGHWYDAIVPLIAKTQSEGNIFFLMPDMKSALEVLSEKLGFKFEILS